MAIEIERKFLVNASAWSKVEKPSPNSLKQGYIYSDANKTIRVRIADNKGFLTIKGKSSDSGLSRVEYEYSIPVSQADEMLKTLCGNLIEKKRYVIDFLGSIWEVDVFEGKHDGLILAEIELDTEEQSFHKPEWIEKEVTGDLRYYNSYLSNLY
jgi:adenylate cyclase